MIREFLKGALISVIIMIVFGTVVTLVFRPESDLVMDQTVAQTHEEQKSEEAQQHAEEQAMGVARADAPVVSDYFRSAYAPVPMLALSSSEAMAQPLLTKRPQLSAPDSLAHPSQSLADAFSPAPALPQSMPQRLASTAPALNALADPEPLFSGAQPHEERASAPEQIERLAALHTAKPLRTEFTPATTAFTSASERPPLSHEALSRERILTQAILLETLDFPMVSVILRDAADEDEAVPLDALLNLPIAFTFAMSANDAGAERAAILHAAGFEILIELRPEELERLDNADLSREEIRAFLRELVRKIPQAIGVIDVAEGQLTRYPKISEELIAVLAEEGMAILTYPRSVNTTDLSARAERLARAVVYRQIDRNASEPGQIRHLLGEVAIEATKNQYVIITGLSRAKTLQAISSWAMSYRARAVQFVPLSSALLRQDAHSYMIEE